jgi:polar amino acid transport system substrate-binding protein
MKNLMIRNLSFFFVLAVLVAGVGVASAQQQPDARVADLVKAGKIRVGLFPPQTVKDPASGELKSVWVEIARALAARIGVQAAPLEYPTPPKVIKCLEVGACDIVFLPFGALAPDVGDFSAPFIQLEYTLLVPAGSSIRSVADADRVGIRIAAVRNHDSTLALARMLKQAELVYAETPDPTFELLRTGYADVMASTRNALLPYSARLPGSRVLEEHYGVNLNRVVILKGQPDWLAYINAFVEEAKSSGLVQKAIDRAGPRGVTVAPLGDPK